MTNILFSHPPFIVSESAGASILLCCLQIIKELYLLRDGHSHDTHGELLFVKLLHFFALSIHDTALILTTIYTTTSRRRGSIK